MMKITEVKASTKVKGRYLVKFQDDTLLRVGEQEILDFALSVGKELSIEEAETLEKLGNLSTLKNKAYNLLSRKPMSTHDLAQKLALWEATPEEIDSICERFTELQLLNDEEYSKLLARHHHNKGYGRKKIEAEFYRHGIDKELWEEALLALEPKDELLQKFLAQKLKGDTTDPKLVKKASDALLRRGFSWQQVKEALLLYNQELSEQLMED